MAKTSGDEEAVLGTVRARVVPSPCGPRDTGAQLAGAVGKGAFRPRGAPDPDPSSELRQHGLARDPQHFPPSPVIRVG